MEHYRGMFLPVEPVSLGGNLAAALLCIVVSRGKEVCACRQPVMWSYGHTGFHSTAVIWATCGSTLRLLSQHMTVLFYPALDGFHWIRHSFLLLCHFHQGHICIRSSFLQKFRSKVYAFMMIFQFPLIFPYLIWNPFCANLAYLWPSTVAGF